MFDGKEKVFNVSSDQPTFLLRKLPSDTKLVVRVRHRLRITLKLSRAFACKWNGRRQITVSLFLFLSTIQITSYNLQGMCKDFYQLRVKTMPAPLIKTGKCLRFVIFNEYLQICRALGRKKSVFGCDLKSFFLIWKVLRQLGWNLSFRWHLCLTQYDVKSGAAICY